MKNTALIVVDYQKCFVEGGSLAVEGGLKLLPTINTLMEEIKKKSGLIVATRDWHPEKTIHFNRWPSHAVAHTESAEYVDGFRKDLVDVEIYKGYEDSDDGYSGFQGVTKLIGNAQEGFQVAPDAETLLEVLEKNKIKIAKIVGLATDFCVASTAEHSVQNGFTTELITGGCASVFPEKEAELLDSLASQGIIIL